MQRFDSEVNSSASTSCSVALCLPRKHHRCKKPVTDFFDLNKIFCLVEFLKEAAEFEDGQDSMLWLLRSLIFQV